MALIDCPSCKQRISSKTKTCNHCGYDLVNRQSAEGLSAQQLESQDKMKRMKRRYSLQMQAMAGIIVFLAGAVLWYFEGRRFDTFTSIAELATAAAGALWYLSARIRIMLFKKNK